jgi:hypothetical protein
VCRRRRRTRGDGGEGRRRATRGYRERRRDHQRRQRDAHDVSHRGADGAEGDGISKEVAQVETFDLQVASVFKIVDPASFLANLQAEGSRSSRRSGRTSARSAS